MVGWALPVETQKGLAIDFWLLNQCVNALLCAVYGQSGQNCKAGSDHGLVARRPQTMKQTPRSRVNRKEAKTVLRLPDLEHAKAAVLNSLTQCRCPARLSACHRRVR